MSLNITLVMYFGHPYDIRLHPKRCTQPWIGNEFPCFVDVCGFLHHVSVPSSLCSLSLGSFDEGLPCRFPRAVFRPRCTDYWTNERAVNHSLASCTSQLILPVIFDRNTSDWQRWSNVSSFTGEISSCFTHLRIHSPRPALIQKSISITGTEGACRTACGTRSSCVRARVSSLLGKYSIFLCRDGFLKLLTWCAAT